MNDANSQPSLGAAPSLGLGERARVVVTTDIGGTDPDDFQSMVHLLLYADMLDIEGLISSPYGNGRAADIHAVIDAYAEDLRNLRTHRPTYPDADQLRAVVAQGALELPPDGGVSDPTEGSELLVRAARREDPRQLHVLAWGGLEDIAQALHDAPDIAGRMRIHWVGGPNKTMGVDAYHYLEQNHRDLSFIESNSTYLGFFRAGEGTLAPKEFIPAHAEGRGALGEFFAAQHWYAKMGDTPTVTWVLGGAQRPDQDSWGGRFVRIWDGRHSVLRHPAHADVDVVENYGVVELLVEAPRDLPADHVTDLMFDNRVQGPFSPAVRVDESTLRFRFAPRDYRPMPYIIRSTHPGLDGITGSFTSAPPPPERWKHPSDAYADWWCDDQRADLAEGGMPGTGSVSPWRTAAMADFAERLEWCGNAAELPAPGA
ncbi:MULTISPECIES: DUF1593 domain-containing protein [Microbacterium]|uniref:DUF1593 domain-containing protein n=1 Tax=Microbacterium TaxID=33882 RepID=UPI0013A5504A|nr:DUF1593 domain-containing protein [Microbacterium sp. KCTC 39802]